MHASPVRISVKPCMAVRIRRWTIVAMNAAYCHLHGELTGLQPYRAKIFKGFKLHE